MGLIKCKICKKEIVNINSNLELENEYNLHLRNHILLGELNEYN